MNLIDNRQNSASSPASSALEGLPHLVQKICALWGQGEFEPFVNRLIMDSRDGARQGLPWEVALELLFLVEISVAKRALAASAMTGMPFNQMYEKCLQQSREPAGGVDPWGDPGANLELSRSGRDRSRSRPPPVEERSNEPVEKKKSWWRRLFG